MGQFIGGFVGVFLSGAGFLLIYSTFLEQEKFNANQDDFNQKQITFNTNQESFNQRQDDFNIKQLNLIESQNKLTDKQQFESTFFNMINTYRSLLETINGEIDIKCDRHLKHYKGYEYFSAALTQIRNNYRTDAFISFISTNNHIPEVDSIKDVKIIYPESKITILKKALHKKEPREYSQEYNTALYEYFYRENNNRLGHYFRFVYNIIKFCIEERVSNDDRKKYVDILQAQISNDESGLIFYNALSKYGRTGDGTRRFYNWLDYFDFFENLDSDSLLFREHHNYYSTLFKFLNPEEKKTKEESNPKPELILPSLTNK